MSLEYIESGSFSANKSGSLHRSELRVISWNINRGRCFDQILKFLMEADADLILLQECDLHAARSGSRNIARDLAGELRLNYVFAAEFEELSQRRGNVPAFHGQATLSRLPLSHARILRFEAQSNFWKPRWFVPNIPWTQRRLGGRIALISRVALNETALIAYNLHLESRNGNDLRSRQILELLEDSIRNPTGVPVIIAGDFNCNVTQPAFAAEIKGRGFRNPFASENHEVRHQSFRTTDAIDWILFRGPVFPVLRSVNDFTPGSDHSPRSLTLRLA